MTIISRVYNLQSSERFAKNMAEVEEWVNL